jgi:LAS seventeen-binding protein 5
MAFFANCMRYPCPYDPAELGSKPPKYHASRLAVSDEKPPPYSEKSESQPPSHKRKISSISQESATHSAYFKRPCRLSRLQSACPLCKFRVLGNVLRLWVLEQRKPYTAVTVQIDRLTSEQYGENDVGGIVDLVEVIRLQASGPTEAARAIRKKLYVSCRYKEL